MKEESRMYKGVEWVTVKEFASRVNRSPRTIENYCTDGKLQSSDVFHVGLQYLKWETQSQKFELISRKNNKTTPKQYRRKSSSVISSKGLNGKGELKSLDPQEVGSVKEEEIQIGADTIILADIDPMLYKSCWIPDDDGNPMMNAITGKPELDMEKLKDTLTVMLSQQKLDKENGKLIPKVDIEPAISYIGRKFSQYVSSIHSRFGSIFAAEVEKIVKRQLSANELTRLQNVLKKDEAKFLSDIQSEFRKLSDEYI